MPRTHSRWSQDLGFPDGKIFFAPEDVFVQAGGGTLTRNAAGDVSINQAASQTGLIVIPCSNLVERAVALGVGLDLQEQFGTAAGVAGPSGVANTSDPADVAGRPPFTGASFLTPRTANIPKGINITDVTFLYQITTNPLAAHTCRIDKTTYANNVALSISAILATGANGLATAAQANPYVTKVTVATNFNITDNSNLRVEIAPQTPAGGTYRFYGMIMHCTFNFN